MLLFRKGFGAQRFKGKHQKVQYKYWVWNVMPMDIDAVQQYSSSTWWIKNPAQKHGRILLVLPRWNRHVKTWHIFPRIFHGFHVSDIQKLRFLTEIRALFGTWAPVHQPGAKLHRGHAHHPCQVDFHVGPGPPGLKLGETTTGKASSYARCFQRLAFGIRMCPMKMTWVDVPDDTSESNHPRNGHCSFPKGGCIL